MESESSDMPSSSASDNKKIKKTNHKCLPFFECPNTGRVTMNPTYTKRFDELPKSAAKVKKLTAFADAPKAIQIDESNKMQKEVREMPGSSFTTFAFDEAVKRMLAFQLFSDSSGDRAENCGICGAKDIAPFHFRMHKSIISRGCIFCDIPLNNSTLYEYGEHVKVYHMEQIKNYKP